MSDGFVREIELKAVVADEETLRRRLGEHGAVTVFEGAQHDRRFDRPDRSLAVRDEVLRLRVQRGAGGDRAIVEYKGAASVEDGYKVRNEMGTVIEDAASFAHLLGALGYLVVREVERDVVVYALDGATVRLERYPRMDLLVEVEGSPDAIESAIRSIGLPRDAFTAEPLVAFVRRFEARTGTKAALCGRELAGDYPYRVDDA